MRHRYWRHIVPPSTSLRGFLAPCLCIGELYYANRPENDFCSRMSTVFEAVRDCNSEPSQRQKHYYDLKVHGSVNHNGDHINLSRPKPTVEAYTKFHGPCQRSCDRVYQITLSQYAMRTRQHPGGCVKGPLESFETSL